MVYKHTRFQYAIRILGILLTTSGITYTIIKGYNWTVILLLGIVLIIQIFALLHRMERLRREMERFFQAIEYSDFSQSFQPIKGDPSLKQLNASFERVMQSFQKSRAEQEAQFRYFQSVVQHIGMGIMVINPDGSVDTINQAGKRMLQIHRCKHVNDLKRINETLPDKIKSLQPHRHERIELKLPESGDQTTITLSSAQFILQGKQLQLISFQNIQSELDEKEIDAWQTLIRVLTHEIMNSITPIASLAATSKQLLSQMPVRDHKNYNDLGTAITTIQSRSEGLLRFVESYRQLTRLPKPQRETVFLKDLIGQVTALLKTQFDKQAVEINISIDPKTLQVYVDPQQMEQVFINLLRNALYWAGRKNGGCVDIEAYVKSERTWIKIKDNGPGILPEVLDKIFIPFYTTSKEGSGIGLSLSRQILRLHGGTLTAQSEVDRETIFTIRL